MPDHRNGDDQPHGSPPGHTREASSLAPTDASAGARSSDSQAPTVAGEAEPRRSADRPDASPVSPVDHTDDPVGRGDHIPDLARLDPRVRNVWWLTAGLTLAVVAVVVALIDGLAPLPTPGGLITTGVVAVGTFLAVAIPAIRYRRWGYALRDRDLWIRQGVFWRTVSVIPYARLQFVDTRQGPLDRLFGLSQLVVHTAALGTSGRLPGLDTEEAERLRERLAAVESDVIAV